MPNADINQLNKVGRFEMWTMPFFCFVCVHIMALQDRPSRLKKWKSATHVGFSWMESTNLFGSICYKSHCLDWDWSKKSNFTVAGMIVKPHKAPLPHFPIGTNNQQQILIPRCGVPLKPTRCRLITQMICFCPYFY